MHLVPYKIRSLSVPYPVALNPHYYLAKEATEDWISAYAFIEDKAKESLYFASEFSFFTCLVYPQAKDFGLTKALCDFMSFYFLFDDPCEQFLGDAQALEAFITPMLKTLDGHPPSDKYSRAFQDFTDRLRLEPAMKKRFLDSYRNYVLSILETSRKQFAGRLEEQSIDGYVAYRRNSIGGRPCFVLVERAAGMELPQAALASPLLGACENCVVDYFWLNNDIYSFNKEIANNEHRGVIEYLRAIDHCSYQEAVDKAVAMAMATLEDFDRACARVRASDLGGYPEIATYLDGLRYWISGQSIWSVMSYRYTRYNYGVEDQLEQAA